MRLGFIAITASLLLGTPALAVDPPIVFQTHPVGQVLDDLRSAVNIMGGEKGIKQFNKGLQNIFGEKGLEGLDISRPIVGYVILAPKPEDITAVIALPITTEKEFLELCERANHQKPKLAGKEKDIYELPPADWRYKALMRFSEQYAFIAYGFRPAPALDPKAIVPINNLYVPTEKGLVAGRIYFDRIPLAVKLAMPTLMGEVKKTILGALRLDREDQALAKAIVPEVEKLVTRYVKLAGGADEMAARIVLDSAGGSLTVEGTLAGKPGSELAGIIAARKPTGNKFGGLISTPDTILGFKTRLPLFEEEIRDAAAAGLEVGRKEIMQNAPPNVVKSVEELFKGFIRTVKTGQFDLAGGLRGPDKNGWYTAVGAVAFEDPSALEKEFKAFVEKDAPADEQENFKWEAAKAGKVNIHVYKLKGGGFFDLTKGFGGVECSVAFAFAPHGVFVVLGPESIETMKTCLAVTPADSPVLDIVINPARFAQFFGKFGPDTARQSAEIERVLGKEDKQISVMSMTVEGGKELKAAYKINLRAIPRAILLGDIEREERREEAKPPPKVGR